VTIADALIREDTNIQWCSGKFGTGGMLGSPLPLPSLPVAFPPLYPALPFLPLLLPLLSLRSRTP